MNLAQENVICLDEHQLAQICTSRKWIRSMQLEAPFHCFSDFSSSADKAFSQLQEDDWLEAFAGHPMIGDITTLKAKYSQGKALSESEQSQVSEASDDLLKQLLSINHDYLKKYGFIFIVCATGKSAQEMLNILTERYQNSRSTELVNASVEQRKISQIRMEAYK
ncbi:2-oxo-4-hydroxy-4-carboxy-5-ureidoimidazoline decarboxylase [Vibrio sp. HN007]|uniref:2-oxo-4-hydroxy-4-carboxy-5-ureidoimidazoline decarboxylase n=1 Tax=Vibrio iocasae TaxID=3098914 RepID=UPI0035D43D45